MCASDPSSGYISPLFSRVCGLRLGNPVYSPSFPYLLPTMRAQHPYLFCVDAPMVACVPCYFSQKRCPLNASGEENRLFGLTHSTRGRCINATHVRRCAASAATVLIRGGILTLSSAQALIVAIMLPGSTRAPDCTSIGHLLSTNSHHALMCAS